MATETNNIPADLLPILEQHKFWLESEGLDGRRADLTGKDLSQTNLSEANLQKAKATNADLRLATLCGTDLQGADFLNAKLQGADLRNANLTDAKNILPAALAGANLTGAKLMPTMLSSDGATTAEKASGNTQTLFISMLLACAYCWLTLATSNNVQLLTNSATSPLPVIGGTIPIAAFYWVAPALLLILYVNLHFSLLRLWNALADLPAVFPDGRGVEQRIFLWLLTDFVSHKFRRQSPPTSPLSRLQSLTAVLLIWWTVPFTLLLFWARYLPVHDWWGTGVHICLLALSISGAFLFYYLAVATLLKPTNLTPNESLSRIKMRAWSVAIGAALIALFALLSDGAINGIRPNVQQDLERIQQLAEISNLERIQFAEISNKESKLDFPKVEDARFFWRRWVPKTLKAFGLSAFSNIEAADVSTKPANWSRPKEKENADVTTPPAKNKKTDDSTKKSDDVSRELNIKTVEAEHASEKAETEVVKGAKLTGQDLRHLNAYKAFLVNADLSGARLQSAILVDADLRKAFAYEAQLQNAILYRANLNWGYFRRADLSNAVITEAKLIMAILRNATLDDAYLQWADLRFADLELASLKLAKLNNADLRGTVLNQAILSGAKLNGADLRANHDLYKTDFTEANLENAKLQGADLRYSIGLTWEQVKDAEMDCKTQLPPTLETEKQKKLEKLKCPPPAKK